MNDIPGWLQLLGTACLALSVFILGAWLMG